MKLDVILIAVLTLEMKQIAETHLKEWNKRGCQMAREVVVVMASESSDEHEKLKPQKKHVNWGFKPLTEK